MIWLVTLFGSCHFRIPLENPFAFGSTSSLLASVIVLSNECFNSSRGELVTAFIRVHFSAAATDLKQLSARFFLKGGQQVDD